MTQFIVRDSLTGEILRSGRCLLSDVPLQARTGEISEVNIGDFRDNTHFFDTSAEEYVFKLDYLISQDKTQITSDGIDTVTFTGIPVDTTVSIRKLGNFVVNDSVLTYKSDIPGIAEFTFINFRYHTQTLSVVVV